MLRDLSKKESLWIEKLLSIDFKGNDILKKQISNAKVTIDMNYAFISIKFSINKTVEKFPYKVRVPVEMRAFQENSTPIVFILHIIDGFVNELEVITADSSKITVDSFNLNKIEYEINKELI